jgi:CSLREA domain-containing protein
MTMKKRIPTRYRDLAVGLFTSCCLSQSLLAATIVVNSTADTTQIDSQCTLREALSNANNDDSGMVDCAAGSGDDVIDLSGISGTITLGDTLDFASNISLLGPSASVLALDGNGNRVIEVGSTATVKIEGVKVTGGSSAGSGGGILNKGTLTLTDTTISRNFAGRGGGIYNFNDTLILTNSTVSENEASDIGGGIYNESGNLILTNTTVSGNRSRGIFSRIGNLTLTNTTVSGNEALGIITLGSTTLTLQNTIIANHPTDCLNFGTLISTASLIEDGSCEADFTGDPNLGPLADNGGPTQTHALLAGSPALDTANPTYCPPTDQRGITRPQGAGCDLGAFERVLDEEGGVCVLDFTDPPFSIELPYWSCYQVTYPNQEACQSALGQTVPIPPNPDWPGPTLPNQATVTSWHWIPGVTNCKELNTQSFPDHEGNPVGPISWLKLLLTGVHLEVQSVDDGVHLTLTTESEREVAAVAILRAQVVGHGPDEGLTGARVVPNCTFNTTGSGHYSCVDQNPPRGALHYWAAEIDYQGEMTHYLKAGQRLSR